MNCPRLASCWTIGPALFGRPPIGKLVLVTLLIVLGIGTLVGRSELKHRALSDAVSSHIAAYQRQRWVRPVLRGKPSDGNAAAEAQKALNGFKRMSNEAREQLATTVHYGNALGPDELGLVDAQAYRIASLHAAVAGSWAVTTLDPEEPQNPAPTDYVRFVDAMLYVLADAGRLPPDACLPAACDVIRLGQDLVPGAPLEAASVSMRVTSLAAPVIARCARGASYAALVNAARELHVMASNPPPTFGGIELEDVQALVRIRNLSAVWPPPPGENPIRRLQRRPVLLEAFKHFDKPARWRAISPTQYPQALQTWVEEQEWRDRSELPLVGDASGDVTGFLFDDMRGQALIRALTVGLATLAERVNRERLPREPINLMDPALADPFNGRPLLWRVANDGGELTIWSVGEDRRDDKGSSEWAKQAPLDVTVHFSLSAPAAPAKTAKRTPR